ncbi:Xaa-Pro aminopeptidase [Motiliproteus coralliicola]|uniref:Xaa-Pro aminopeptidase n=1 Tax=Motiliproteus coralliicola TaxID=2283196 RepID=A0A369WA33_9GAMM|nr:Xaa-Pro aminopeptidase [Motiliproteus coralliicola]RDE18181.1 Xaa-Pro aminopeptidase [Motiliproteus coralliicola]
MSQSIPASIEPTIDFEPIDISEHQQRRERLLALLPARSAVLLRAASLKVRNRDAEYPFRQHSDFHYLSGFPEPEALMLLIKDGQGALRSLMFVQPRDPEQEVWTGYRVGAEGVESRFGFDKGYTLEQLDKLMPPQLQGIEKLYFSFRDTELSAQLQGWCQNLQQRLRSAEQVPQQRGDLDPLLHELRLIKSPAEQQLMRAAGKISAAAHRRAMQKCRPGWGEYRLEAEIQHEFGRHGCRFPAYASIVGGGANGCVLHYTQNSDILRDGDLVLIDAGAEVEGYAGDITRTFPINGRFSADQKAIYQLVLDAQEVAISVVKPGAEFDDPHQASLNVLVEGLVELGLLQGETDELIEQEAYKPFYMHRTSHWLGLDVHDVGEYKQQGESRPLEAGMVLTIEPGLYIAPDNETVEPRWRGIGIRIEDDVLVTDQGHEVLTESVPKSIDAIEQLMQSTAED